MKYLILLFSVYVVFVAPVVAGLAERTVTYTEPAVNDDEITPLVDLAKTSIYYDINGDGNPPALYIEIPATSASGGGVISQIMSLNLPGTASVQVWATATDTSGNESTSTPVITIDFIPVDVLAPQPPQGFSVF